MTEFDAAAPARPLWLMTLADLALLLVGFFVLLQATQQVGGKALARGLREGFGVHDVQAMPVAATGVMDFAPGSATIRGATTDLIAFARDAGRDPRVTLTVTGSTDGSAADVDAATQSAVILAADRARAVAAILASVHARVAIATVVTPGRRAAIVTLAFTGDPKETP